MESRVFSPVERSSPRPAVAFSRGVRGPQRQAARGNRRFEAEPPKRAGSSAIWNDAGIFPGHQMDHHGRERARPDAQRRRFLLRRQMRGGVVVARVGRVAGEGAGVSCPSRSSVAAQAEEVVFGGGANAGIGAGEDVPRRDDMHAAT
jgi:hypothetical protein